MRHRIIIPLLFFAFTVTTVRAQSPVVKTEADKTRILLGEPITIKITVQSPPAGITDHFFADSIPHFERVKDPQFDSSGDGDSKVITGIYTFTSFDSGHWVIPAFVMAKGLQTDSIPADVVFSDFNPDQDYHDIRDIIPAKPASKNLNWLFFAAGGLVVVLALIYYLTRKKKKPVMEIPVVQEDFYSDTMKELARLESTPLGDKEYYSELISVFRLYVLKRKGILSLQKTTDDLVLQLKDIGIPADLFSQLAAALRMGDFVKFAKYKPGVADRNESLVHIKTAVTAIEKTIQPAAS